MRRIRAPRSQRARSGAGLPGRSATALSPDPAPPQRRVGRALGSRLRAALRAPEAVLFALVLGAYAYFYQAGGWNQNSRFDLTRAIVEDHALQIDRFAQNTGDLARLGEHLYCDKAPGVSLLGALPYQGIYSAFGSERPSPEFLAWAAWACTLFAVGLPSAIGVVFLSILLGRLGLPPLPRLGLAAAWGLATLALPYSTLYYGHQLSAALLISAFAALARRRGGPPVCALRLWGVGAAAGAAVVAEYPAALGVLVLAVYAILRLSRRDLGWIAAGGLLPAAVLAAYHSAAFGGPLELAYEHSTQPHRHMGFFMGLGTPDRVALWHLLGSSYRGLFYSAPWLLLAAPGALRLHRAGRRSEVWTCAALFALFLWLNVSLVDWAGGWAMGPRYLIPALPFLVALVGGCFLPLPTTPTPTPTAAAVLRRHALRLAAAPLIAWSAVVMLSGTAVKPEVPSEVGRPFLDMHWPLLRAGELAVSTQGIDMRSSPRDHPREAWNLGQQLGLRGLASLLPLLLWSAALLVLLHVRASVRPFAAAAPRELERLGPSVRRRRPARGPREPAAALTRGKP